MNTSVLSDRLPQHALPGISRDAQWVLGLMSQLRGGSIEVHMPGFSPLVMGQGDTVAQMNVHDMRVFSNIVQRGDIGFSESYLDGDWSTNDLVSMLTLFVNNRSQIERAIYGSSLHLIWAKLRHAWLNRNTRKGSRRNIMAHYDLGNDFYRLWLDSSMTYSAAWFGSNATTDLHTAQVAKYQRMIDRLHLQTGQHVLEIGCGWGGFAKQATEQGVQVTGITLSPSQLEFAQRRAPAADLRLQDYRDLNQSFDHIVSIEMFEAVGESYWDEYFQIIKRSLKSGGHAMIQSITIHDQLFAKYRKGTDFIQQYIFPGGMLPSRQEFVKRAQAAGLQVIDQMAFGIDYAKTLAIWRQAFEERWPQIREQGYGDDFRRLWRYYLCYCEAGFRAGSIDVVQFDLVHA